LTLKSGAKPGKTAKYLTTVHSTGGVLLGKTYVEQFGMEPGDKLRIAVDDDCIRLMPAPVEPVTISDTSASTEACSVAT
jgi:bifunctional DNA-binding transcriptional regulator/antitoxin component of YhaV-PrlF toxin-antitoxin module